MGLDATVRCRCFEEGKLKPGSVPYDDLYIDGEGYLASRMLDSRRAELGRRRFAARYGELERAFYDWSDHCCEHEDGDYVVEWVSNWAGVAGFESRVEEAGGEAEFPLLSHMLPHGNGGIYPVELAEATLKELDRFLEIITNVDEWVLVDAETEERIWTSTPGSTFVWMRGPYDEVGMAGGRVYFEHTGLPRVETTHFKQHPVGKPAPNGCQQVYITCLDTGKETLTFDGIGVGEGKRAEREFYVTSEKAPFLWEGKYGTAERIRRLLLASLETGNPIRWC